MFYSHEVLTNRKYGVATIWLVATLGAKSNTRKLGKKAILDVDVRKACDMIIEPEAPMALRLKSSLLYGVSRIYAQQCDYVLSDAQALQSTIRGLTRLIHDQGLNLRAGEIKPDQLLLHDDPAFLPSLEMPPLDFHLGALDWSQHLESQISPGPTQSQFRRPRSASSSILDLNIQSSSEDSGCRLPDPFSDASDKKHTGLNRIFGEEPLMYDDNLDFDFGEDGQMRERPNPSIPFPTLQNSPVDIDRIRQKHEVAQTDDVAMNDVVVSAITDNNGLHLKDAEAFPVGRKRTQSPTAVEIDDLEVSSAEAPQQKKRKTRKARVIKLVSDRSTNVSSQELKALTGTYLTTMKEQKRETNRQTELNWAKQSAYRSIFGMGLNGIANGHGRQRRVSSLAEVFSGDKLFFMVTGSVPLEKTKSGRKSRADGELANKFESSKEPSPVFQQDQYVRGDNDDIMRRGFEDDPEVGRDAPSAFDDHPSSVVPWNVSASLRSYRTGPVVPAYQSSMPQHGRHSRFISASPLLGRGKIDFADAQLIQYDNLILNEPEGLNHGSPGLDFSGEARGFPTSTPPFSNSVSPQAFDPHTHVEISQVMREAMAKESMDFYEWVRNTIEEQETDELEVVDANDDEGSKTVIFDTLIVADMRTVMVAASAFHHVLTLATRGLFTVRQENAFGDIELGIRGMIA